MNRFIVKLRCDITDDIVRFFNNRNIEITHFDKILPDTIIVKTDLTRQEFNKLQYVFEAKEPRIGRVNI